MWIHCTTYHWQMKSVNFEALEVLEVVMTDRTIPALIGYLGRDRYAVIYEGSRETCADLHQSILSHYQAKGRVFHASEWRSEGEAE